MEAQLEKECINFEEKLGFYSGRVIAYPLIPPEHVYFSLTNRCNLRCKMCGIPTTPSKVEDELPTAKVKEVVYQIKELGIRHLILSGGEPLLRKDLLDIIEFATLNSIEMVDIISNGILLNDNIIQQLIKIRLNHITVSLDGLPQTNNNIRGERTFALSEENIDKINFYKSIYKSSFPTIGINFTIMDKNIDDILPMIEFARLKKCNIIVFQPILFNNTKMYEKKKNILWPSRENVHKLQKTIKKVIDLKRKLQDIYIYTDISILEALPAYFNGMRPGNDFRCYEAIKRIVITYDGTLWSCSGAYGDLKKQSLKEIWFSKKAQEARNKVKTCKEHCLQDCVYFPSNIFTQAKHLIDKIILRDEKEKNEAKSRLLAIIEHYINILSKNKNNVFLSIFTNSNFNRELRALYLIKGEIRNLEK